MVHLPTKVYRVEVEGVYCGCPCHGERGDLDHAVLAVFHEDVEFVDPYPYVLPCYELCDCPEGRADAVRMLEVEHGIR